MNCGEISRSKIPLSGRPVRSLCWQNDELVDWAGGGRRFRLDGSTVHATINWAYRFDAAITSRDGTYSVIYERLGTKGLVLRGNTCLREINRSFYQAHVYEFPIVMFDLPGGSVALAHCPDGYNQLDIEDIESGKKLTARPGKSPDFFHSRLRVSPDGAYLLSAGWVWHPLDCVNVFLIHDALKQPDHLDEGIRMKLPDELMGVNSAEFHGNDTLLLVGNPEDSDASPSSVAEYKIKEGVVARKCVLESVPGTIMPVGQEHFMGFYEHPKLFEISSGKVIQTWPDLNSGKQNSSIIWNQEKLPPLALDTGGKRFAVADANNITVIQLG